jgi:uncharacterized protein
MRIEAKLIAVACASLALALAPSAAFSAGAKPEPKEAAHSHPVTKMPHRVVIQISDDDPKVMNVALNNAENLTKFYKDQGETVQIEFVAYGPGLAMVRSDTSPVKSRLESFSSMKNVSFSGCGNTLANQSAKENKQITLLPEAHIVPTGIARIVELQEQGWSYVRP